MIDCFATSYLTFSTDYNNRIVCYNEIIKNMKVKGFKSVIKTKPN